MYIHMYVCMYVCMYVYVYNLALAIINVALRYTIYILAIHIILKALHQANSNILSSI